MDYERERRRLVSYAGKNHFDGIIDRDGGETKERWSGVLRVIETKGSFSIDEVDENGNKSRIKSWEKIRKTLNKMTNKEIQNLNGQRDNTK